MRIAILSTWHRRCGVGYYFRRAFRQLGHEVIGIGPWRDEEPWGTRGREPDVQIVGGPVFDWGRDINSVLPWTPDLFFIADGGEGLRVDVPDGMPWVHLSSEGSNMAWSRGLTPHRYASIMCNGADEDVAWLPNAFDRQEHRMPFARVEIDVGDDLLSCALQLHGARAQRPPAYDLVQLASARAARQHVWGVVKQGAPDLHTVFGDLWGPLYAATYGRALATYACSSLDFVTTRVFEAMAMGCVVIADRTPSIAQLFTEGEHFIGYDPVPGPGGEGMPEPGWLIETVRRLKRDGDGGMSDRALQLVQGRDSYEHRAMRILGQL